MGRRVGERTAGLSIAAVSRYSQPMTARRFIAALLALGGLLALQPLAEAKDRGSCATHIAPICHAGQHVP